ncbi:hypothetical protein [Streptacidiphilus carbonis]|uniref:hypothetical protein n=1 Tax=Streptacidiphilus carbonis TaxID=105422 RepID=UPI000693A7E2|nr:hypothetical protein [Streptacidiphilus carbonis]
MSSNHPQWTRDFSALLLGNRYRAEVLLALARAPESGVCLGDLALELGAPASAYQAPMRALIAAGLAERLPRPAGERRQWYRRAGDAELWRLFRGLLERLPDAVAVTRVG